MQITFFESYWEAARELDSDDRLAFYDALLAYAFDGVEPQIDGAAKAMFILARPNIDKSGARRAAGRAGGKQTASKPQANAKQTASKPEANPKQTASKPQANPKQAQICSDFALLRNKEKEVGEKKEKKKERKERFTPPTLDEVREHVKAHGYTFDAETFHAYYTANGWKAGRNPMKSWQAACVTWQKRQAGEKVKPDAADKYRQYDRHDSVPALWEDAQGA